MLASSFNSPKHIILFSVLLKHNLQGAHIQRLGYRWYFNVPFASRSGFQTLTDTLTLFSNLVPRALFSLALEVGCLGQRTEYMSSCFKVVYWQ